VSTSAEVQAWRAVQLIMTFTLVSVVYAAAVAKPGHGNCAPLAIGFTLFASAFVGACPPDLPLQQRFNLSFATLTFISAYADFANVPTPQSHTCGAGT
jgi:Major intrinsic protein